MANIFRKYRDYTMFSGGVLANELAVHALRNKEKVLARNKKIVYEQLEVLERWSPKNLVLI